MEIEAKLLEKYDTVKITDSFQKREFVVEYAENPQYPEFLKFELIQDKCSSIDSLQPGDKIKISFNLKGRKWTDKNGEVKYFNSMQAWKIDSLGGGSSTSDEIPGYVDNIPPHIESAADDDLPF